MKKIILIFVCFIILSCSVFQSKYINIEEEVGRCWIEFEVENRLKFKAYDRLRNLIQENPNETQLWNKLAELYYESGFLDSAGKY